MFELFKTIIDEPSKLKKYFLFLFRFILNAVTTSKIYSHYFGVYSLLSFNKNTFTQDLYNFVIEGHIIIIIFIFLGVNFLLYNVLILIPDLILNTIIKRTNRNYKGIIEDDFIGYMLDLVGVIKRAKSGSKVSIGNNFYEFYDLLSIYQRDETKDEVHHLKKSILNEFVYTYFLFLIIIFFFITIKLPTPLIVIMILGFFVFCYFYISLYKLINIINTDGEQLLFHLHKLKIEQIVYDFLNEIKITLSESRSPVRNNFSKIIQFNDKDYIFDFYSENRPLPSYIIQKYLEITIENNMHGLIILTDNTITPKAKLLIKENREVIKIIKFNSEEVLLKKLENYFFDK